MCRLDKSFASKYKLVKYCLNLDTKFDYFFIIIEFSIKPSRDPHLGHGLRLGTTDVMVSGLYRRVTAPNKFPHACVR
jgi:hypothetical protein